MPVAADDLAGIDKRNLFFPLLAVFVLVEVLGYLLTVAYPYGFNNVETSSWWLIAENFKLFAPNADDWWRTIPAGAVLKASLLFPNPSIAVFWFHNTLFAINMALLFLLSYGLFRKTGVALALALCTILVEVLSAHTFYFGLQMKADPLYANLLTMGTQLALISYVFRSYRVALVAYAILGLTAFTKSVGIAAFPVFLPVAILLCARIFGLPAMVPLRQLHLRLLQPVFWRTVILLALLSMPVFMWQVRNLVIYGRAEVSAFRGMFMLCKTMPLMRDTDRVLDDPQLNREFIAVTREFEKKVGIDHSKNETAKQRYWIFDWYLPWRIQPYGPFDFLADRFYGKPLDRSVARGYFDVAAESAKIGTRLLLAHPLEAAKMIAIEYYDMFNPLKAGEVISCESETIQADPAVAYDWMIKDGWKQYPPGWIDLSKCNKTASGIWAAVCRSDFVLLLCNLYYNCQFVLFHCLVLGATICGIATLKRNSPLYASEYVRNLSFSILVLALVTVAHYATVAAAIVAAMRYMSAGELTMRIAIWLAVFASGLELVRRISFKMHSAHTRAQPLAETSITE